MIINSAEEIRRCCSKAIDDRRIFIESCKETNKMIESFLDMVHSGDCEKLDERCIKELYAILDDLSNRELFITLGANAGLFDTLLDCLDDLTANRS